MDALSIASKEQRKPCKFPWFVVDLLAIFRASTVPPFPLFPKIILFRKPCKNPGEKDPVFEKNDG